MRKFIFLLIAPLLLSSCSFPRYLFENRAQTLGLDFTKDGKWLLNFVEAPADVQDKLTAWAVKDFSTQLNQKMVYIADAKGIILPRKVELNPTKGVLSTIKKGCGFDYFINIKAVNTQNDLGSIDFTPHRFNKGGVNSSVVIVEVYDLNLLEIIYSQKVEGFAVQSADSQDVHFSKPNSSLVLGAYKKIMNDIMKKSIKNKTI